jgi:hypothetical protein
MERIFPVRAAIFHSYDLHVGHLGDMEPGVTEFVRLRILERAQKRICTVLVFIFYVYNGLDRSGRMRPVQAYALSYVGIGNDVGCKRLGKKQERSTKEELKISGHSKNGSDSDLCKAVKHSWNSKVLLFVADRLLLRSVYSLFITMMENIHKFY